MSIYQTTNRAFRQHHQKQQHNVQKHTTTQCVESKGNLNKLPKETFYYKPALLLFFRGVGS